MQISKLNNILSTNLLKKNLKNHHWTVHSKGSTQLVILPYNLTAFTKKFLENDKKKWWYSVVARKSQTFLYVCEDYPLIWLAIGSLQRDADAVDGLPVH